MAWGIDSVGTNGSITTITDTPGNTYTKIGGTPTLAAGPGAVEMWYAKNITGGTNIVKVVGTFRTTQDVGFAAFEYSGVDTVNALDRSAFGTGNSDLSTGLGTTGTTATTGNANDLLFAAFNHADSVGTVGSGWTNRGTAKYNANWTIFAEDKIVSATGAYAGTFSCTTLTTYQSGVAAFQQQAAAATGQIPSMKSLMGVGF